MVHNFQNQTLQKPKLYKIYPLSAQKKKTPQYIMTTENLSGKYSKDKSHSFS